jgi:hypothetical protein
MTRIFAASGWRAQDVTPCAFRGPENKVKTVETLANPGVARLWMKWHYFARDFPAQSNGHIGRSWKTWVSPRSILQKKSITVEQLLAAYWLFSTEPSPTTNTYQRLEQFADDNCPPVSQEVLQDASDHLNVWYAKGDVELWVCAI